jgi:hypothetical protein
MKHKGIICGILAAVCYGTNPFGALPLYEEGVNTSSDYSLLHENYSLLHENQ